MAAAKEILGCMFIVVVMGLFGASNVLRSQPTMLNINNDNFTDDDIDKAEIFNDNEIEAPPF
jgi:hypothetical protein